MDVDELFDSFGDGNEGEKPSTSSDTMRRLEQEKEDRSRELANNLLQQLQQGNMGSNIDAPVTKRARVEEETEQDDVETFGNEADVNRMKTITLETGNENCTHQVCLPVNYEFQPLIDRNTPPAKQYPFRLDSFQKEAIVCIENNQSVLVSAHTSAGKTVVALYAIAQCLRDKQRVIYTSPIKALSNQKYRDLEEEFGDVGLMTGDVTLNPDASCIVMTTEILRSMLYRGSEMMKEVGYVIFDEIHYMRDKERGVVWEETIILMSPKIHYVFLSATIPNAEQFALWIAYLKNVPCHVIYTEYRPTPLQHFIFPCGGDGLYEVVNMQGTFREDKFNQAMNGLAEIGDKAKGLQRGRKGGIQQDSNVVKIIRTIKERDMLPCIIFSFSRKECEAYAISLKDMDFNKDDEKKMVEEIYHSAVDLLSDSDKKLPQIAQILPLLKRGIGVHHSGLLPLLKEVIEILFGEGLLKTLFATETFSMGLNMPARTVLFTSARKYDGVDHRWITSGEYIQMSGRAGRRGKDDRGLVILMVDSKMSSEDAKQIIKGKTDPLNSQFRLTYNMVLNLIRVEGFNPETMMRHSFRRFQALCETPKLTEELKEKEQEIRRIVVEKESEIQALVDMEKQMKALTEAVKKIVTQPKYLVPFLHAGRLLHIKAGPHDFGWGTLVNFARKSNPDDSSQLIFIIEVLVGVSPASAGEKSAGSIRPPKDGEPSVWEVVPMTLDCIDEISAIRIKLLQNLKPVESRKVVEQMIVEAKRRFNNSLPLLHPVNDMKIKEEILEHSIEKEKQLKSRYDEHPLRKRKDYDDLRKSFETKEIKRQELQVLRDRLKETNELIGQVELENRKRVLRRLQYCSQDVTIEQKGRVACELSATDELMLTEMLYGGVFNTLAPGHLVALLSCFVFQENAQAPKLAEELSGCLRSLHEYARRIAKISNECKLEIIEDKYVDSFKAGLMDVVYNWANGMSFAEIVKTTDVFEGSIIRCLRRLEEVLREMINASKAMANKELEDKLEIARTKIKRDIVFAASLYL
ncbi:unnamed protein product [Auanema sp. JU1783]|nr:unnamed protein product [Auanema sp. JU1783]